MLVVSKSQENHYYTTFIVSKNYKKFVRKQPLIEPEYFW